MLASEDGILTAKTPTVEVLSTIGAGDSMIAGFVGAYAQGMAKTECLKTAVAYGTAACMQSGTRPPKQEDVAMVTAKLSVENY